MIFIALRSFRCTDHENLVMIDKPIAEHHVHHGARFSIGKDVTDVKKLKPAERTLYQTLFYAKCLGNPDDPATVAKINAEIANGEAFKKRIEQSTKTVAYA